MHVFKFLLGVILAAFLAIFALMLVPLAKDTPTVEPPVLDQQASMPLAPDAIAPVAPNGAPDDPAVEYDPRRISVEELQAMRQDALALQKTAATNQTQADALRNQAIRAVALADSADLNFAPSQRREAQERRLRCLADDPIGCSDLATLYLNGTGVFSDKPLAISLYTFSCDAGADAGCSALETARAPEELADSSTNAETPLIEDINATRDQQREQIGALALALDENLSEFMLHYYGRVQRAKNGCRADQPADCIDLGHYYWREYASTEQWGILHNAPDLTAARALYLKACELDDAQGCYEYAGAHDGMGDETDPSIFLPYRDKACEMGLATACAHLGDAYQRGADVTRDHAKAAGLYTQGCDLGDAHACTSLGRVSDIEDPVVYVDYALRSCLHGDGFTCAALAHDFKVGEYGLTQSADVARTLLVYGCDDGDDTVCEDLANFDS